MDDQLAALETEVAEKASAVASAADLENLRTDILGRKGGRLSSIMSGVGKLPKEERADFGRRANETKTRIEAIFESAQMRLGDAALQAQLARRFDVTFPGIAPKLGSLHILRQTLDDVAGFFRSRGFAIVMGPEVETEYFNFEAMNIPADHPARDNMDTFYLKGGTLLRTHTSPMQVRAMLQYPPPIAILGPRQDVPARRFGRAPCLQLPSIRGTAGRSRHHVRTPQGLCQRLVPSSLWQEPAHAFSSLVFPIHRTIR